MNDPDPIAEARARIEADKAARVAAFDSDLSALCVKHRCSIFTIVDPTKQNTDGSLVVSGRIAIVPLE